MSTEISQVDLDAAKTFMSKIKPTDGETRVIYKCKCGNLYGRQFIPFGIGVGTTWSPCLCIITNNHNQYESKVILQETP